MRRVYLLLAAFGFSLGYSLSRMGFTDFGEVNRMFRFADLRLFLTFACGAALLTGVMAATGWRRRIHRPLHKGIVPGSCLFGAGWAIAGACPGVALVQLGEGQGAALVTFAGMLFGTQLHRIVNARWLKWDRNSCDAP